MYTVFLGVILSGFVGYFLARRKHEYSEGFGVFLGVILGFLFSLLFAAICPNFMEPTFQKGIDLVQIQEKSGGNEYLDYAKINDSWCCIYHYRDDKGKIRTGGVSVRESRVQINYIDNDYTPNLQIWMVESRWVIRYVYYRFYIPKNQ